MEEFEQPYRSRGLMVGFIMNAQRPLFADRNIRRAMNYVFDFQAINRGLFFDSYRQYDSYFTGLDELASSGVPEGAELALLEELREDGKAIPDEVFTTLISIRKTLARRSA